VDVVIPSYDDSGVCEGNGGWDGGCFGHEGLSRFRSWPLAFDGLSVRGKESLEETTSVE